MNMNPRSPEQTAAAWYDEYYRTAATGLTPWNEFLLPELAKVLKPHHRLVELGCGQGDVLRYIAEARLLPPTSIHGFDQSQVAVEAVKRQIPGAHCAVGDLHQLDLPPGHFDFCLLMETIEHLTDPLPVLRKIHESLAPDGVLYLSFPNYLHLPWYVIRILSEKLNKPNWINLQPVDRNYNIFIVRNFLRATGFELEHAIGTTYCPPMPWWLLRRLERPAITRTLNRLGLWWISFHPIMKFRKLKRTTAAKA
jgi:2-polyprenyl-3-methyl-5-hydroxy-6-metoxy-1,4-benzoquinol methylase